MRILEGVIPTFESWFNNAHHDPKPDRMSRGSNSGLAWAPFLTKQGLYKILRAMFRKAVAILLVTSWAVLSAVDVLEDLNLGADLEIHASGKSGFPGFGRAAQSVNNIVENGSRHIVNAPPGLIAPTAEDNVGFRPGEKEAKTLKKHLRMYKLHKAFLI
jgi:hypothetical protein